MMLQARYQRRRGAFELDVNLELEAIGITAIFGPSGSGKTSLLRALAGLDPADQGYLQVGDLLWHGPDINVPTHKRQLGYVFQEPSLLAHLNVAENINFGRRRSAQPLSEAKIDELLELLSLHALLTRDVATLSGGEQQRVAIARALATNPRLLLMDEPLAALDEQRKNEVLPYIVDLHERLEIPILYVSHALDEVARIADYLVLLETGRVTASGRLNDVLTRLELPLASQPDAEVVVSATVLEHHDAHFLTTLAFSGGCFEVAKTAAPIGSQVRLRVAARDVSITLEQQIGTSILNIFACEIAAIQPLEHGQAVLKLRLGQDYLLARISQKSLTNLNLALGKQVFAQVKSVAVLV